MLINQLNSKIICVMLISKRCVPEQTQEHASSGVSWFDAGLTVCSITIIFALVALTACNFAVQPGH